MKTKIIIKSQFGHEIMAVNFAKAFNLDVVIAPNKDEKKAYEEEADKIFRNMSFFYNRMSILPFEERNQTENIWDIIGELKNGKLDNSLWEKFAASRLTPANIENLPAYPGMSNSNSTLFIPQKLISDGECGISAEQQSLPLSVFEFLKTKTVWFWDSTLTKSLICKTSGLLRGSLISMFRDWKKIRKFWASVVFSIRHITICMPA